MDCIYKAGRAVAAILFLVGAAFGQQISCGLNTVPITTVHAEGLAERIGDLTLSCTGGTAGSAAQLSIFVSLNTNITNKLDSNGVPQGITVTLNTGGGAVPAGTLQVYSSVTLLLNVNYTVPAAPATPVLIGISGIRAAVGSMTNGTGAPVTTVNIQGIGAQYVTPPTTIVAIAVPTLLSSIFNSGIPCGGSPLPTTTDFYGFVASSAESIVRVTEASPQSFTPKDAGADTGTRILINMSGYSAGARVFVPDVIVGSDGSAPTNTGAMGSTINSGTYTPGLKQLLLVRIPSADATGAGGSLPFLLPGTQTTYSSLSEVSLTSGSGFAVYEVLDSNINLQESALIPLFLVAPQIACVGPVVIPTLSVAAAPVSTVSIATAADPVPRFLPTSPGPDCKVLGDCSASYFPNFTVDTSPIVLSGASLGPKQGTTFGVSNTGGGIVSFTTAISYQTGAAGNWLLVSPSSGQNSKTLQVIADPSNLQPGTYTALISVNAGTFGSFTIPVTLTVGPAGITIQNVLNAASGASLIVPGSYTALYGVNLAGQNVAVTFANLPATIIFDSASQINLIVPRTLSTALADVVVTIDGKTSNKFTVTTALNQPGIFNPGIENADGSVNTSINPVARGSFVAVYLTGLTIPLTGPVTVNIGGANNLTPIYAGAQGSFAALDQVDVTVPLSLPATPNPVPLTICIPGQAGQPACSNAVNLYIK